MLASKPRPDDTTTRLLERLGAHLTPADRVPGYVFGTGRVYGSCPRCGRWESIHVLTDGSWRAACRCWGKPWQRLTRLDALVAVLAAEVAA